MSKLALAVMAEDYKNYINEEYADSTLTGFWNLPTVLLNRTHCETDPRFLQIIPYIGITRLIDGRKEYLMYKRGKAGNEGRLHDMYSIGIGGHVEDTPTATGNGFFGIVMNAASREIDEELGWYDTIEGNEISQAITKGMDNIYYHWDQSTLRESVHLGLMFEITVPASFQDKIKVEQGVIDDITWVNEIALIDMANDPDINFEPWTRQYIELIKQYNEDIKKPEKIRIGLL